MVSPREGLISEEQEGRDFSSRVELFRLCQLLRLMLTLRLSTKSFDANKLVVRKTWMVALKDFYDALEKSFFSKK